MGKTRTRMLVEAGAMIALAQVLSYLVIFEGPFGGSVTAGSMIPIMIFAIRWGWKNGLLAGAVYGVLQFLLGPKWSFHPISLLFDYPLAFGPLGLAGLFKEDLKGVLAGVTLGLLGRFIAHVISGVLVFASYAPEGMHPLVYSLSYNASYLGPELLISLVIIGLLYRYLKPYIILR